MIGIANLPLLWRSRLQLAFELVEETPIGAFRYDLEHPIFAEASIFVAQIRSGAPKVDTADKFVDTRLG
jgi:hypothetical protein